MQPSTAPQAFRLRSASITFLCFIVWALAVEPAVSAKESLVYFGTFTNESSKGIYVSRLNMHTGKLSAPELAAAVPSPNFLAVSPDGKRLFAATRTDTFNGMNGGSVSSFALDPHSGMLTLIDQKYCGGTGPCHVSVDAPDHAVLVANYTGGSVKSFHLDSDGRLTDGTFIQHHGSGVNTNRQSTAHAHCFVPAPKGRFALACDLGLDKVMIYKVNPANASLTENEPAFGTVPPGSGARHLAFSPSGKTAYVVNEMACTVTAFSWDGLKGKLDAQQSVPMLPPGMAVASSFSAGEIGVRPDGRFVYATVRGHDSISVLAVDGKNGRLSFVENVPCGGQIPRGMGIDPSGYWLIIANQKSENVVVFNIDGASGRLKATGQVFHIGAPVDVKFAPAR